MTQPSQGGLDPKLKKMTHDIRNTLSAMLSAARAIKKKPDDPGIVMAMADAIESSIVEATRILTEMVNSSQEDD